MNQDFEYAPPAMEIAFCVDESYARYVAVTIKSICENHRNKPAHIHILTDSLSGETQSMLHEIVSIYPGVSLSIHEVDDSSLQGLDRSWTIYAWYRLLLPEILPANVSKVLYLDADIVVTGSLTDLFEIDLDNYALAAGLDIQNFFEEGRARAELPPSANYICSGVMLLNLDFWRKHDLAHRIAEWSHTHVSISKFPDQDAINAICWPSTLVIPMKYGVQSVFYKMELFYSDPGLKKQLADALRDARIVHFAGAPPWIRENYVNIFLHWWQKYNRMLRRPAPTYYKSKGLLRLKTMLFKAFHPNQLSSWTQKVHKRLGLDTAR